MFQFDGGEIIAGRRLVFQFDVLQVKHFQKPAHARITARICQRTAGFGVDLGATRVKELVLGVQQVANTANALISSGLLHTRMS